MKILLIAFIALAAVNAQAGQTRSLKAKAIFHTFAAAFPELKEGLNHSESMMARHVYCISNSDEFRCTAKGLDDKEFTVEGGNIPGQPEDAQLSAIWKALERAHLPVVRFQGGKYISLKTLYCDHLMPGSGEDSYVCDWEQASDTE